MNNDEFPIGPRRKGVIDVFESFLDILCIRGLEVFLGLATLIVLVGHLSSCVLPGSMTRSRLNPQLETVAVSPSDKRHTRLVTALGRAWVAVGYDTPPEVLVVKSTETNAASLGGGRFVVWEGVAELPDWAVDAIWAHEVAHDQLLHSRRVQDLHSLTVFFTELIGFGGGADFGTSETLNRWGRDLIIPRYSRKQELAADRLAVLILAVMGRQDPKGTYIDLLELMSRRYGEAGGGFLGDHPAISERIQAVRSSPAVDDAVEKGGDASGGSSISE